jgi:hypothetical protein
MKPLSRQADPTGFFNLLRYEAAMRFGDPAGVIQGRGRQHHHTKSGPGRRRAGPWNPPGAKLWNACPLKRPEWRD